MTSRSEQFPTDPAGLREAGSPETLDLKDGDRLELRIAPVAKRIGDALVRMLAYNGSVPGPTLRVRQGSTLAVHVLNEGDLEATVHWHGLRLDNRYDGTLQTQSPMPIGGTFTYLLTFPDPGVYWYHPHIREDYGQEMGLYGSIVVVPSDPDYWPPVDREITLMLDDILVEDGRVATFSRSGSTHTAMGRFGNVLLANGEPDLALPARSGEVVRLYLTNTANTRFFNIGLRGARMKRVGGDSGRCEREEFVEAVLIAPSERVVVDVLFDRPGRQVLEHRTPERTHTLATIDVGGAPMEPSRAAQFGILRTDPDLEAARARFTPYFQREPDKTLTLVAEMNLHGSDPVAASMTYACPMHPEVRSTEPGRCPRCGMKLAPARLDSAGVGHHHEHDHDGHERQHGGAHPAPPAAGIEWEDEMVEVNRTTTPANTRWKLIDGATGAEGSAIDWRFRVGDLVKIRLVNTMDSDHPMPHPVHIHGAGRFLILARDGTVEPNLVWKDTVMVGTGERVDVLLEVTNPGRWMAHCHIAEHHEGGMMFSFLVEP